MDYDLYVLGFFTFCFFCLFFTGMADSRTERQTRGPAKFTEASAAKITWRTDDYSFPLNIIESTFERLIMLKRIHIFFSIWPTLYQRVLTSKCLVQVTNKRFKTRAVFPQWRNCSRSCTSVHIEKDVMSQWSQYSFAVPCWKKEKKEKSILCYLIKGQSVYYVKLVTMCAASPARWVECLRMGKFFGIVGLYLDEWPF